MFTFLAAHSIVFMDLYFTLKNPFYPRGKRVIWYQIYLLICFLFGVLMAMSTLSEEAYVSIMFYVYLSLYFLTLVPTVLVSFKLCKKGTSKTLRKLVVRRHLIFFAIYTFYFTILLSFDPAFGYR